MCVNMLIRVCIERPNGTVFYQIVKVKNVSELKKLDFGKGYWVVSYERVS